MKEHTEQHLDNLAKKVIKSSSLESPSFDFTAQVMGRIEAPEVNSITTYQPLISKKTWFIILTLILIGALYLISQDASQSTSVLDKVDYSVITNNKILDTLSNIAVPKILLYAIGLFGLLWCVQIPLLKYQFEKRLEY